MSLPPPPLTSRQDFQRRLDRVRGQGKLATIREIQPALADWLISSHRRKLARRRRRWALSIAIVCLIVLGYLIVRGL